ncbi:MAG: cysteine--tRNA ligase [Rickettsiales bacterium]|nr:cysteine--tRNA ligase [Rickettsiales bacterium]|tara:strand:- start:8474 stop:9856 length:1383 start_codon:yes stop_codon:yes gene_type:complete
MADLYLYSSKSQKKQLFVPLDPEHIKMYVCGPTVYDYIHIGNARPVVVFDVLYRVLRAIYPSVTYARNLTDVDDKIIDRALEKQVKINDLTAEMIEAFQSHVAALNSLNPDVQPRATDHIKDMIQMIERLIKNGAAYQAEGHVLFDVSQDDTYGDLSHRCLDDMKAGARVNVESYKRNPNDFVLWKPADSSDVGWDSPWGYGRPGWHIECSAMIQHVFKGPIDIHGGGIDLLFPHHENENAQSRCALKYDNLAQYWVHNGLLQVEGTKMSKSLGNFYTLHEKLQEMPGELIRLILLSSHYRQPLDWTENRVHQSRQTLNKFYQAVEGCEEDFEVAARFENLDSDFAKALLDDLNTVAAIQRLQDMAQEILVTKGSHKKEMQKKFIASARFLGFLDLKPEDWFHDLTGIDLTVEQIQEKIQARSEAKQQKDYQAADQIRNQLQAQGIALEDGANGTAWRRV